APRRRIRIDVPGAVLVASGMFVLVFALSQGGIYGWWQPLRAVRVGSRTLWPATWAVSMIPAMFALSVLILSGFVLLERRIERGGRDPLFEFAHLRIRTYRYGLVTAAVVAMGQLGLSFVLPIFLQDAKHLTAATNGLWLLPTGLFVIVGSQVAGRLTVRFGTTAVVRAGLALYAGGILLVLRAVSLHVTAWDLLPGLALYGFGIGFAGAQLTNVILSEVPLEGTGGASGANSTIRQVGSALGVSVIGSLLTVQTISNATSRIRAATLPAAVKAEAIIGVHRAGSGYVPPRSLSPGDTAVLRTAIEHGLVTGTRVALLFAVVIIAVGGLVSILIPGETRNAETTLGVAEYLESAPGIDAPAPVLAGEQ
ncbi:MAG: MFS transporter, partial [Actinobacteria bacterium]|nr:MFS transporter [Actinomycetota bacterium]